MKHSISYHITLFIIKLKGLKKVFSKDPIDYEKIRKDDIHHPRGHFYKQDFVRKFMIRDSLITEVKRKENSDSLVIFLHGGAFIAGPTKLHWDVVQECSNKSNHAIWMCDYPKAPENKITTISENIDYIYKKALEEYSSNHIILIGDSVGGTLITALVQRLVKRGADLPLKIILISPLMDATLSNPQIAKYDQVDPILSTVGVLSANKMCAGNDDLGNAMLSPLYSSFDRFPNTVLFIAEHDITYPDQKWAVEKLTEANVKIEVIEGRRMPHIWPYLPVMKEAKEALGQLIARL